MDKKLLSYLRKNHRHLDLNRQGSVNFNMIQEDIKENQIFLAGENHGVKANVELKLLLLKYFKRETGFKYLISELPASVTYFINRYLETGSIKILKSIYKGLKGTDAWNLQEYNFWIELFNFNKNFPKEERILALGIDIEHQEENALKFMEEVLGKEELPTTILELIKEIRKAGKPYRDRKVKEFCFKVKEELIKNRKLYKSRLGENYFLLTHINGNILDKLEAYGGNNFEGVRDRKLYKNFLNLVKVKQGEKFFGQIGLSHIFQRSFPNIDWFARALNEESQFKGKVISIAYAYRDCKYLYPTKRRDYTGNIDTMDRSLEEFNLLLDKDLSLFSLNRERSPFQEDLVWPLEHKLANGGATVDYFQYLLVIRNSREMDSLKL